MKKGLLLLPFLLLILICKGQSPDKNSNKVDQLCSLVNKLFQAARNDQAIIANNMENAPSEAIIILLEIDSTGNVSNIHLLADPKNKDSAYIILSSWKASDFKTWKDETYKGKTMMIPFIVLSRNERSGYVESLTSISVGLPKVVRNLVTIRTIVASWPYSSPDYELTPSKVIK